MYRWLRLPCLLLSTALLPLGIVGYFHFWNPAMLLLACIGLGFFILGTRFDIRNNEAKAEVRKLATETRLAELMQEAAQPAAVFAFACASSGFGLLMQSVVFGALGYFLISVNHWLLSSLAILSLIFAISAAFRLVAEHGDRQLVLNAKGISGLGFGLIPWSAIEGISARELGREKGTMPTMIFFVPGLPAVMNKRLAHPWKRWIRPYLPARTRNRLWIRLKAKGEYLEVVEGLARLFWKESTGRTQAWIPDGSDELNRALRQQGKFDAEIEHTDWQSIDTQEKLDRLKQSIATKAGQVEENQRVIKRELGKHWRQTVWIGGLLVAAWILFILYKLFNH